MKNIEEVLQRKCFRFKKIILLTIVTTIFLSVVFGIMLLNGNKTIANVIIFAFSLQFLVGAVVLRFRLAPLFVYGAATISEGRLIVHRRSFYLNNVLIKKDLTMSNNYLSAKLPNGVKVTVVFSSSLISYVPTFHFLFDDGRPEIIGECYCCKK